MIEIAMVLASYLTLYNKTEENCNTKGWKSWPKFLNLRTGKRISCSFQAITPHYNVIFMILVLLLTLWLCLHMLQSLFIAMNSKIGKYKMFSSLNVATNASFVPISHFCSNLKEQIHVLKM